MFDDNSWSTSGDPGFIFLVAFLSALSALSSAYAAHQVQLKLIAELRGLSPLLRVTLCHLTTTDHLLYFLFSIEFLSLHWHFFSDSGSL